MADNSIYTPLPPKSHTIRLLCLWPGQWTDKIASSLEECSVSEARHSYVTISYTWGNHTSGNVDTTKQVLITCNGRRVPISENLFTILRRLRLPDSSILVWADALCINQMDTIERTHQVGMMGEIYRNSRETVIWLGEQTDHDDVGGRFLGDCISHEDWGTLRRGGLPRIAWQGDTTDQKLLDAYIRDCRSSTITKPLKFDYHNLTDADTSRDIFGAFCLIHNFALGTADEALKFLKENEMETWERHDYPKAWYDMVSPDAHWTRIWVIQETVLSRKATIHFGMLSAPWSMFASAAAHYARERHTLCLDLAGTFQGQRILTRFSNTVLQIDNTRHRHQDSLGRVTLLSLLWAFRPLEASDKRDKVFALLGLTTNWQGRAPVLPDYNIDVGMTFIQTAISIIQRTRSLSVLAGDHDATLSRKRLKDIPSWVMDWALPCLPQEVERVNSLRIYNASGGRSSPVRLHQLHSILEVEGVYIGDVVTIGNVSRHTQITDTCNTIREWKLLMRRFEQKFAQYPNGDTYYNAFWRTLIGDLLQADTDESFLRKGAAAYRRATLDDLEAFQAWSMWTRCISRDTFNRTASFTQRDLDEGISSVHYALKAATASRRFFFTSSGYMGIGPKTTSLGDRLYVFKNSRVPFLLRPDSLKDCVGMPWMTLVGSNRGNDDSTGICREMHSCHRLVGDCFAYGLMDGEALEKPGVNVRRLYLA
ncbi:heterokaryon incompatibility protein-domain-containing protein [Phaeosphaeriaceae sp. PMI808]|nr:heterokaryon incompatibility protein-domain-containing protein [Phaeosphaeriaceae sp. PMI808]